MKPGDTLKVGHRIVTVLTVCGTAVEVIDNDGDQGWITL